MPIDLRAPLLRAGRNARQQPVFAHGPAFGLRHGARGEHLCQPAARRHGGDQDGKLNAYWMMVNNNIQAGANLLQEGYPGYRNPDNFVAVSDMYPTVTAIAAHLILPAEVCLWQLMVSR